MKQLITILLTMSYLLLTACSTHSVGASKTASKQPSKSPTSVINLKKLQSLSSITQDLSKHRTVFVGEIHTAYSDHLNQLAVIKNLHQRWQKKMSIGLEMVQQPYQPYLDKYIAGEINEHDMLLGIEWYDRWMYDFRLYRPIFNYARQNKIPLIALNIPKELTQRITEVGIKGLSATERKQLPAFIDRSNKNYVNRITKVFTRHQTTQSKGVAKFLDAQLGWDEGMAYAAARYLKKHPQKRMVIIAGGGHVIGGEGIPDRLDRMIGSKSAIVLNNVDSALNASQGDYLLDSPAKKLAPIGLIGIMMKNTEAGVKISMVSTHGAAKKVGLKKGDYIVKLGDTTIKNTLDVRLFAEKTKPGDVVTITVRRNHKVLSKRLKLRGRTKHRFSMHRK